MIRSSINFGVLLALLLVIVGGLQLVYLYANEITIPWDTFTLCYVINYLLAIGIYVTLLKLADQKSQYLGFIFLFGSALKFMVYFLIFDPLFKQDGQLETYEFFLFFVPYMTSLIAETIALANLLRRIH